MEYKIAEMIKRFYAETRNDDRFGDGLIDFAEWIERTAFQTH